MEKIILKLFFISSLFILFSFQNNVNVEEVSSAEQLVTATNELIVQGQYEAATINLLKLVDRYRREEQWNKVVWCYNELGAISENDAESGYYLKQALLVANEYLNDQEIEKVIAIKQLAEYYAYFDADSALYYSRIALELLRYHQEEYESEAWINYTIGEAYYYKGVHDSVTLYLLKAEQIAEAHGYDDVFEVVYNLLGAHYYSNEADLEKAIGVMKQSLNLALQNGEKTQNDSLNLVAIYNNVGIFYEEKKSLNRALQYYELALKILGKIESEEDLKTTLENYGRVHFSLGNTQTAIQTLQKGLLINENTSEQKSKNQYQKRVYSRLGKIYNELGKLDSATYFIERSVAIAKQTKMNYQTEAIIDGVLNFKQKKYTAAAQKLSAIPIYSQSYSMQHIYHTHLILNTIAKIETKEKNYTKALENYQRAIAVNCPAFVDTTDHYALPFDKEPFRADYLIETLGNKAITLTAMNTAKSLKAAFETNQLAIRYAEMMRSDFVFEATKVKLNQQTATLYKSAIEIAYQLYNKTGDSVYLEAAFEIAEKQKGILLLEALIDTKGKKYYKVPEQLLEKERQLKTDIAFYKQKMLTAQQKVEAEKYELYQSYYTNFSIELGNLKDTLRASYRSYFDLEYQNSIATVDGIQQQLLQPQQAFIQYFEADSLLYAFVLEQDESHFIALPITDSVKLVLNNLQMILRSSKMLQTNGKKVYQAFKHLAFQNYQNLLAPLLTVVTEDINELLIVPDGRLNYLSFEALLKENPATDEVNFLRLPYLIHDYQFHYGYSGTLLLENQKQYDKLPPNDKILAYAPSYEDETINFQEELAETERSNTVALFGAKEEVAAIRQYFKGKFDIGKTATKENFMEQTKDFGILHLATHGQPDLREPNYAHLIFAKNENKDALLHHYEITTLDTKAQLAVLSACETGVGKVLDGEGVMSLGRGFMYAGVPSIVISLWKMNDRSTSQLMPLFYENLSTGMRKDKALHQAKLDYLNQSTAETAYPFYWAGFVGIGDIQPIKTPTNNSYYWIIGGFLLLMTILFALSRNWSKFGK